MIHIYDDSGRCPACGRRVGDVAPPAIPHSGAGISYRALRWLVQELDREVLRQRES